MKINTNLEIKQKRYILAVMASMVFLGMAATDIYIPSLPQMTKDFLTTANIINLTLSFYTAGIAIGVLFVGELSNRYGRRQLLILSSIGFFITSLIIAAIHFIWLVILCRIIQSFCAAITIIVSRLVLKDCLSQEEQLKANGILLIGLVVSPAIAPIVGAYLSANFGWQSTFIVLSMASAILAYMTFKFIPETNTNLLKQFNHPLYYIRIYLSLLQSKRFISTTLLSGATNGAYFSFIGISSYLFILHWGFTPEHYSLLFLLIALAYLIGNFIMQLLNRRGMQLEQIIQYGMYVTTSGGIIMLISPILPLKITIISVVTGTLLMRLATALINPAVQIKIMNSFSHCSSQAIGLSFCISFGINSIAISSVSIFQNRPLLGLIIVSGTFITISSLSHRYNRQFNSK